MLDQTADVVFADDKEKLCGHGGDVLVRAGQQRHQAVPQRASLLRFILLNTVIYINWSQQIMIAQRGSNGRKNVLG